MTSSAGVEYYTPAHVIAAARRVLGAIDLDPASTSQANGTVRAQKYYTQTDNGLVQPWSGRVWLNPPFGDALPQFVQRLCWCYQCRQVSAALLLVPARVDTRWWRLLQPYPVCFLGGRLRFSGQENSAPFATAVVYLGPAHAQFAQHFEALGLIYTCVSATTPAAAVQGCLELR